jgi:hypothetical protein
MRKVKRTKYPILSQLTNMSLNLREKFKTSAAIDVQVNAFSTDINIMYWFWISNIYLEHHSSWESAQDKYFELMEGDA